MRREELFLVYIWHKLPIHHQMKEKELNQRLVVINHSVDGLLKSIKGGKGEEMREMGARKSDMVRECKR